MILGQYLGAKVVKDTLAICPELFKLGNPGLFLNILQQYGALTVVKPPLNLYDIQNFGPCLCRRVSWDILLEASNYLSSVHSRFCLPWNCKIIAIQNFSGSAHLLPAFPRPLSVPVAPLPRPEEGTPNQNFLNLQICKKMQIGFYQNGKELRPNNCDDGLLQNGKVYFASFWNSTWRLVMFLFFCLGQHFLSLLDLVQL